MTGTSIQPQAALPLPTVSVVIPCYRDSTRAIAAVRALLAARPPGSAAPEIIVADDGSGVEHVDALQRAIGNDSKVIALPVNQGRSAVRNAGARAAGGDVLLFMDCDCLPQGDLAGIHARAMAVGGVASTGAVRGVGDGRFWDRYQALASRRRAGLHARGISYSGSSQNLAVRRAHFLAIEGFDESFEHYGFEDRDLLLRLAPRGAIHHVEDAAVLHQDPICLLAVCRKMREAGCFSSARFRARHPDAYRDLGYAFLDVAESTVSRLVGRMTSWALEPVARAFDVMERANAVPFWLGAALVRAWSALAYLQGTADREARNRA